MALNQADFIRKIHDSGTRIALAVTGGGSAAISDLFSVPGASKSIYEAVVPYAPEALARYLRSTPERNCDALTARRMAMTARERVCSACPEISSADRNKIIGVGATSALVSDRPKRGEHRIHLAAVSASGALSIALTLEKGGRDRSGEERLAADLILLALERFAEFTAENQFLPEGAFPIRVESADSLLSDFAELSLLPTERPAALLARLSEKLSTLLFGDEKEEILNPIRIGKLPATNGSGQRQSEFVRNTGGGASPLFAGSFNPLHRGHRRMIELGEERFGGPIALELAVTNVDKPPIDPFDLAARLSQIREELPGTEIWLTRFPLFWQKAEYFGPATFLLGADTLRRLSDPAYHGGAASHQRTMERIAASRCRFLVFARREGETIQCLSRMTIHPILASLCDEIPPSIFIDDISSTELRKNREF